MITDLSDVTFLIPIRIDSIARLENVLASVKHLLAHFNTNVIVLEANRYNNNILKSLLPSVVEYIFVEDWDPIFHRTKYINTLFSASDTPIVSIWDADIIIPAHQLIESVEALRSRNFEVAFPYDGSSFDVSEAIRDVYMESFDVAILENNISKMYLPYGSHTCGGALFITSKAFVNSGKEDERFYGWGPEDWNRLRKWEVLGYRSYRPKGPLFHLSHPRDVNGHYSWDGQKAYSSFILEQTRNSLPEEL